jgi:hypothetical protein
MCSGGGTRALPRVGFPIRKSSDQRLISSSPRLIAAVHVLHRLQVPRHPPCALIHLICVSREHHKPLWSFQGARGTDSPAGLRDARSPHEAGVGAVSQNSTVWGHRLRGAGDNDRCRRIPGEPVDRTAMTAHPRRAAPTALMKAAVFPRKEVIQPQLPLRLPCYDFTPITDATFGRCLPCGLAHGLRVFPAFVV